MLETEPDLLLERIYRAAQELRLLLTRMKHELPEDQLAWYLHDPDMPIGNLEHALGKIIEHVSKVIS